MNYIKQKINKATAIAVGTTVLAFQGSANAAAATLDTTASEIATAAFSGTWVQSLEKAFLYLCAILFAWAAFRFIQSAFDFEKVKMHVISGALFGVLGLSLTKILAFVFDVTVGTTITV
jgi:hypothetical protein